MGESHIVAHLIKHDHNRSNSKSEKSTLLP